MSYSFNKTRQMLEMNWRSFLVVLADKTPLYTKDVPSHMHEPSSRYTCRSSCAEEFAVTQYSDINDPADWSPIPALSWSNLCYCLQLRAFQTSCHSPRQATAFRSPERHIGTCLKAIEYPFCVICSMALFQFNRTRTTSRTR